MEAPGVLGRWWGLTGAAGLFMRDWGGAWVFGRRRAGHAVSGRDGPSGMGAVAELGSPPAVPRNACPCLCALSSRPERPFRRAVSARDPDRGMEKPPASRRRKSSNDGDRDASAEAAYRCDCASSPLASTVAIRARPDDGHVAVYHAKDIMKTQVLLFLRSAACPRCRGRAKRPLTATRTPSQKHAHGQHRSSCNNAHRYGWLCQAAL